MEHHGAVGYPGIRGERRGGGEDREDYEHALSRPEMVAGAKSLVVQAREETRQRLLRGVLPDESEEPKTYADLWWRAFGWRLKRNHRDAVKLYPQILGMLGGDEEVLNFILTSIGVGTLEEAREKIKLAGMMDQIRDPEAAYRMCMESIRKYRAAQGLPMLVEPERIREAEVEDAGEDHAEQGRELPGDDSPRSEE